MLKSLTAIVTGGSRGIGREIALKFAQNGADVAIIYAGNNDAAQKVLGEIGAFGVKAIAYKCDISNYDESAAACAGIIKEFGRADILVNNAGITRDSLFLRMTEQDFDAVLDTNLKGAFNFTKNLSRYILKSPQGRIINISSVSGLAGNPGQANYSAAKAGLIGFTKTLAKEFSGREVTVNAVAPGFIETDMTKNLPDAVKEQVKTVVPLKRMGTTTEVAALVLFLASGSAAYITGEVIRIDGGMCI